MAHRTRLRRVHEVAVGREEGEEEGGVVVVAAVEAGVVGFGVAVVEVLVVEEGAVVEAVGDLGVEVWEAVVGADVVASCEKLILTSIAN